MLSEPLVFFIRSKIRLCFACDAKINCFFVYDQICILFVWDMNVSWYTRIRILYVLCMMLWNRFCLKSNQIGFIMIHGWKAVQTTCNLFWLLILCIEKINKIICPHDVVNWIGGSLATVGLINREGRIKIRVLEEKP